MICPNCGKELSDHLKFCIYCGKKLPEKTDGKSNACESVLEDSNAPAPQTLIESTTENCVSETAPIPSASAPRNEEPSPTPPVLDGTEVPPIGMTDAIGKNASYYSKQFQKTERGEKENFNWAAFFFGPYLCLYRKFFACFKKYYLIPVVLTLLGTGLLSVGVSTFSLAAMIAGGVFSLVGSVWNFVSAILCGKNFNRLYYAHCKEVCDSGDRKRCGTSFKPVLILIAAIILLEIICTLCAAVLAGSANDTENDQAYPLRGEYAVVANADSSVYIHLLFSDGQMEFYDSYDSTDVIVAPYIVKAPDADGYYPLYIKPSEDAGYIEFFSMLPIMDDAFSIRFSAEFLDGVEQGGEVVMVPFTAEYGFGMSGTVSGSDTFEPDVPDYDYENTDDYGWQQTRTELIGCPEAYKSIIVNYWIALMDGWDEEMFKAYGLNPYCSGFDLSSIGFAICDLDDNGILELVITDARDYAYAGGETICDLFTLDHGEACRIARAKEGTIYTYCENGSICCYSWLDGSYDDYGFYYIDTEYNELSLIEGITYNHGNGIENEDYEYYRPDDRYIIDYDTYLELCAQYSSMPISEIAGVTIFDSVMF